MDGNQPEHGPISSAKSFGEPPSAKQLTIRALAMLEHYFDRPRDEDVLDLMIHDWVKSLRNYPAWIISEACQEYLIAEPKRTPNAGLIAERCEAKMRVLRDAQIAEKLREMAASRPAIEGPKVDDVELAHRLTPERANELRRAAGFEAMRVVKKMPKGEDE